MVEDDSLPRATTTGHTMPRKARTPCTTCGTLAHCEHRDAARRYRNTQAWRTTRTAILTTWRLEHGDWCPGWGTEHPPHPTPDLTVHHIDELATTGHDTGRYAVLCRSWNAKLGAR